VLPVGLRRELESLANGHQRSQASVLGPLIYYSGICARSAQIPK